MSRRGRAGATTDEQLLAALDRLVEAEGIVKASERLGVSYRTAANCHETRHASRKMREVLQKHLRDQGKQVEVDVERDEQVPTPAVHEPRGEEVARLQEPEQDLRHAVELLRAEVEDLRQRLEAVEGHVSRGRGGGDDRVDVDNMGAEDEGERQRSVAAPRCVFPELITEEAEPDEERAYGAAAELVVEWREAWAARKSARHTVAWLRAERQRLELELRLIGLFGLTPPPYDALWRDRRREQELDWRCRAWRRLRWRLPLTWCLHGLLRLLMLGLWGRAHG